MNADFNQMMSRAAASRDSAYARDFVGDIVKEMVKAGYPVETTNKADHRADYLPIEHYGWRSPEYFTENLARILVGGWWSKGALVLLVKLLLDRLFEKEGIR